MLGPECLCLLKAAAFFSDCCAGIKCALPAPSLRMPGPQSGSSGHSWASTATEHHAEAPRVRAIETLSRSPRPAGLGYLGSRQNCRMHGHWNCSVIFLECSSTRSVLENEDRGLCRPVLVDCSGFKSGSVPRCGVPGPAGNFLLFSLLLQHLLLLLRLLRLLLLRLLLVLLLLCC